MNAFVDAGVLLRHLTGEPADEAARATAFLTRAHRLYLTDPVVVEVVSVLESFYGEPRQRVAELVRAIVGFPRMTVRDRPLLLRALELYERDGIGFAEAYLVAAAEASGVAVVASFDERLDAIGTISRVAPS